jgi:uncharacterized protein
VIRVVVDTNVIVSAMISSRGNEALLLIAVHEGRIQPCFSPEILKEYSEVLQRPKFGFRRKEIDSLLAMLRRRGTLLASVPSVRTSPDPSDDKFIACALAAKAEFLVTGNKKHFPPVSSIRIVGARELLDVLASEI